MDGPPKPLRLALVDLDWRGLDVFRPALAVALRDAGRDPGDAADAEVRLVVADGADAPAFRWARLAGVPRAGEVARLGEVVVDAVIVSSSGARAAQAARLAAALGAIVVALPAAAGEGSVERAGGSS